MQIAPLRCASLDSKPWEGNCAKKPHEYIVTATLPCLDGYDHTALIVELLRLQTCRPFIMLVDTGSTDRELQKLESLRAEDCEVHVIRANGACHPSDFPAWACDLAMTLCRTQWLFMTHNDVFPRRNDLIAWLLEKAANSPVVGYEMSPRNHTGWEGMVSHTCTLLHMPTMDKIGAGWSMRRLMNSFNVDSYGAETSCGGFPDTESLINYILRAFKIEPNLIGTEENFVSTVDRNIYHARTITAGRLYSQEYYQVARSALDEAMVEARANIHKWREEAARSAKLST